MRKLFLILAVMASLITQAQYSTNVTVNNTSGFSWNNIEGRYSVKLPRFLAPASGAGVEGNIAYNAGHIYFNNGTAWVQADGAATNIYTSDGTILDEDRFVNIRPNRGLYFVSQDATEITRTFHSKNLFDVTYRNKDDGIIYNFNVGSGAVSQSATNALSATNVLYTDLTGVHYNGGITSGNKGIEYAGTDYSSASAKTLITRQYLESAISSVVTIYTGDGAIPDHITRNIDIGGDDAGFGAGLQISGTFIDQEVQYLFDMSGAQLNCYDHTTGSSAGMQINTGEWRATGTAPTQITSSSLSLNGTNGLEYLDGTTDQTGIKYLGDYSATFVARSLVDKGYVDAAIAAVPITTLPSDEIGFGNGTGITSNSDFLHNTFGVQLKRDDGFLTLQGTTHFGFAALGNSSSNGGILELASTTGLYFDLGAANMTAPHFLQAPNADGTLGVSINGIPFDVNGNAVVSTAVVGSSLTNKSIWIGDASNTAQEQIISGDATMTNLGALTISAGAIDNSKISASAAIAWSKMAALTASRLMITDGSGFATTATGTGFIKSTAGVISYDNSTYLTTATAASTYQPLDADLTTIAGLTATTDNFIVGVSSAWASRTPAQVRTTLGLVIGTNVQAWDTDLDAIAALSTTTFGRGLLTETSASTARSTLGLGTLATQSGTFSGTSSGTNTGDQTITLTGDVTGSGTGSFATTINSDFVKKSVANTYVAGMKQTFVADGTNAGLNFTGVTANPSSLVAGDMWFRSDDLFMRYYDGSSVRTLVNLAGAQTLTNKTFTTPIIGTILNGAATLTIPTTTGTLALVSQITGTNSGINTGDQTISLTGDVTGSGTGSFAATIANSFVKDVTINTIPTALYSSATASSSTLTHTATLSLPALATQSAYQVFATGSSTATPTFQTLGPNHITLPANSMMVNNTAGSAVASTTDFKRSGDLSYSQVVTSPSGTAPTGTNSSRFYYETVGNLVTLTVYVSYATASVGTTSFVIPFPTGAPTPVALFGLGAANDIIYPATGFIGSSMSSATTARCALTMDGAGTGYQITTTQTSGNYKFAWVTVQYFK